MTKVLFRQKDKLEEKGEGEGEEEELQGEERDLVDLDVVKAQLSHTLIGLTNTLQHKSLTLESHIQVQLEGFQM